MIRLKVIEVEGVRGYVDQNNVAWLNAEDVARGLGFVMVRKERVTTSGDNYESIRWNRINEYLAEYNYPPIKAGDFIPENIFYRLAMKASNEAAQNFQAKIADEIMPSIRKQGFYSVYDKEIRRLECARVNFESARVRMECERMNLENARERLNDAVEEKKIERANLLRELALATNDNDLRDDLIRSASKLLIGEDFSR